jgi:hypothetical protein
MIKLLVYSLLQLVKKDNYPNVSSSYKDNK